MFERVIYYKNDEKFNALIYKQKYHRKLLIIIKMYIYVIFYIDKFNDLWKNS